METWMKIVIISISYILVVGATDAVLMESDNNNSSTINNGTSWAIFREMEANATFDSDLVNGTEPLINQEDETSWTNRSVNEPPNEGTMEARIDYLGYVMEPIFFTTGVIGNSLTIVVMRSKQFKAIPVSITLTCMAISDITVTVMHPFNRPFFRKLTQLDLRSINGDVGCKLFYFFWRTAKMTSSWFVVFVSIERFFAVWFPMHVKIICSRRNTILGLLVIYLGIGSVTGAWTFASGLKNGVTCTPDLKIKGTENLTRGFLYAGTILYSGLPTVLMIICTTLITWKLIVQRKVRKNLTATKTNVDKETVRITSMLFGITVAFLLLINPHAILHNISFALGKDFYETASPTLKTGREVAQVLEQINYSINFFLYVLCSRQFRTRVTAILGLSRCCNKKTAKSEEPNTEHRFKQQSTKNYGKDGQS